MMQTPFQRYSSSDGTLDFTLSKLIRKIIDCQDSSQASMLKRLAREYVGFKREIAWKDGHTIMQRKIGIIDPAG